MRYALNAFNCPAKAEHVARNLTRARTDRATELLYTLVSLGQCRVLEDGRYVA
jgi:hypothetical protein